MCFCTHPSTTHQIFTAQMTVRNKSYREQSNTHIEPDTFSPIKCQEFWDNYKKKDEYAGIVKGFIYFLISCYTAQFINVTSHSSIAERDILTSSLTWSKLVTSIFSSKNEKVPSMTHLYYYLQETVIGLDIHCFTRKTASNFPSDDPVEHIVSQKPEQAASTEVRELQRYIHGVLYGGINLANSSNHRIGHFYCNMINKWYIEINYVTFMKSSSKLNCSVGRHAQEWLSQFKTRSGWESGKMSIIRTNIFSTRPTFPM
jgi:hypothetical protein